MDTLLLVFARARHSQRITNLHCDSLAFGYISQITSKKGAVVARLNFDDTSLCFVNLHLESSLKRKAQNLDDIHLKAFQQEKVGRVKKEKIEALDCKVLLGNVGALGEGEGGQCQKLRQIVQNYRIAKKNQMEEQSERLLQQMLGFDLLQRCRGQSEYLVQYSEPQIQFLPTCKLDKL